MLATYRLPARGAVSRRIVPVVAAVFLLVAPCANAAPASDEEMQNHRLGYNWTPKPSSQPMSRDSQIAWNIAKYGGGGIAALWLLRKLVTN
jgi:hypothetical protein